MPAVMFTKKMLYRIFTTLLIIPTLAPAQNTGKLDSSIAALSARSSNAGFSICVVKKDSFIYSRTFGYRDIEKKLLVTENTVFAVGSCTKAFTAALIGMTGTIKLDTPAHNYLPQLKFYTDEMTQKITVRDLLTHRSGLPRHDFSWFLMASSDRDSMLSRITFLEPNKRVAEKWQYNNFGYLVLGKLHEQFSRATYEQGIEKQFLQPLSMSRSYFSYSNLQADSNVALGYRKVEDGVKRTPWHPLVAMAPAGGLNSTALDMGKWLSAWIMGRIIPRAFRTEAISSQVVTKPALPNDQPGTFFSTYGFGWFLSSYRGHYRVEHGGNIDGFTATATFFPADSIGIVVLSNRENSLLPAMIRNALSDHFLTLPDIAREAGTSVASQKQDNPTPIPQKIVQPLHDLNGYTGSYQHSGYGRIIIYLKDNSLLAKLGDHTWSLQSDKNDTFSGTDLDADIKMKISFELNTEGNAVALTIPFEPTIYPIRFTKQYL